MHRNLKHCPRGERFVRLDSSRDGALTRGEEVLKARQKFPLLTCGEKGLRYQLQVEIFFLLPARAAVASEPLLFPPPIPLFLSSFSVRLSNLFFSPLFPQKRGRRKVEDVLIGPDWKYFSLLFVFASRGPFSVRLAAAGDQFPTLLRDKVDFPPREGGKAS